MYPEMKKKKRERRESNAETSSGPFLNQIAGSEHNPRAKSGNEMKIDSIFNTTPLRLLSRSSSLAFAAPVTDSTS
jgi:hypothetical protein